MNQQTLDRLLGPVPPSTVDVDVIRRTRRRRRLRRLAASGSAAVAAVLAVLAGVSLSGSGSAARIPRPPDRA